MIYEMKMQPSYCFFMESKGMQLLHHNAHVINFNKTLQRITQKQLHKCQINCENANKIVNLLHEMPICRKRKGPHKLLIETENTCTSVTSTKCNL